MLVVLGGGLDGEDDVTGRGTVVSDIDVVSKVVIDVKVCVGVSVAVVSGAVEVIVVDAVVVGGVAVLRAAFLLVDSTVVLLREEVMEVIVSDDFVEAGKLSGDVIVVITSVALAIVAAGIEVTGSVIVVVELDVVDTNVEPPEVMVVTCSTSEVIVVACPVNDQL